MTKAAIFIPSNRKLEQSIEPLWSAIGYAQARGINVVISDNSGDPDKREYFAAAPSHVTYLADGPEVGPENALNAINGTDADFVMMLGDDDSIAVNEAHVPFDFSQLTNDVMGVKPRIEIVSGAGEVIDINMFAVEAPDAAGRVIEYSRKMNGGNSTFYSFFRRDAFHSLLDILARRHPTRVGNVDFAIVYALVAAGRIVHDPSTIVRYDNSHWDDEASASESMNGIFLSAGLPESARQYMLLFHFLDAYVLMFRKSSALPPIESYKAAYAVAMVFLKRLVYRMKETPFLYHDASDLVGPLELAVESADPDLDLIFEVATRVADRVKPGLKQQYDHFLQVVAKGE
jgi:hypothetical protein